MTKWSLKRGLLIQVVGFLYNKINGMQIVCSSSVISFGREAVNNEFGLYVWKGPTLSTKIMQRVHGDI